MVAPSFQNFEFLTEPYSTNGKMYIRVRNPKTKTERQVRWYTEKEYYKLYPEEKVKSNSNDKYYRPLKEVLGFNKGYITLIRGDIDNNFGWLANSIARYHKYWGWYIVSTENVPDDIPFGLNFYQLNWESIGLDEKTLKSENVIKKFLMENINE